MMAMTEGREPIDAARRIAAYRLIAELLLYPETRDRKRIERLADELDAAPAAIGEPIRAFRASPRSEDPEEYLTLLELAPPCPLYLGAYLFEEPATCRGAGLSGRNGYLIELAAIYGHFGFEIGAGELADFLPAMAEFLALSLEHGDRDGIGLRRRFIEHYLQPGLAPMQAAWKKYDTPYASLIEALSATLDADVAAAHGEPAWLPPRKGCHMADGTIRGAGRGGRGPDGSANRQVSQEG